MKKRSVFTGLFIVCTIFLFGQTNHGVKFEQMGSMLPDGNVYRSMSGAPGPEYWQQKCDYDIACTLDAKELKLMGEETITYTNHSPQPLKYLWLQLDENQHSVKNNNQYFDPSSVKSKMSAENLRELEPAREKEKYGVNIHFVKDANGKDLKYFINQTMMRVDLPKPLNKGEQFAFQVKWDYYIVDRISLSHITGGNATNLARGGYEYFPEDGNYLFTMTQWYPRLCAFTDYEGWQNNQFTGRGEFALTFGDFNVRMTVPEDHVVGSTGECQNYDKMLSKAQLKRWKKAQNAKEPIEVVTLDEALENEKKTRSTKNKTWHYTAQNVRDFAWTASPKFVWDAVPHTTTEGKKVMCMSYYGKEAYPIYNRYSTKAVVHTLEKYSKFSIPYPYPIAISVEAASGMEYPMICFNPGRAEPDGTYTEGAKNSAISVIIHEVGHNYFPMIINSDERQWAWFDEGLNSFVQYLAEQEWDNGYQSWFGPAQSIVPYMSLPKDKLEPIMTNAENINDYFQNAYSKPATALNILRESIMGRELFDAGFKEYCERWAFKHPTPADFFRSMEDASGLDLDWFWKGWFYTTDNVDISLDSIIWYKVDLESDPKQRDNAFSYVPPKPTESLSQKRTREAGLKFKVEEDKKLQDFYYKNRDKLFSDSVHIKSKLYAEQYSASEKKELFGNQNYYELQFSNKGGLVMPVIIEWTFKDGTKEVQRLPAEIWRSNESQFKKVFIKDKEVTGIVIDPYKETADVDRSNNDWPVKALPSKFQVYKSHKPVKTPNAMQKAGLGKKGKT